LGYISPVSTLVKWFPDRRGMATGMAIMGFGGGAMIGSPLADILMNQFRSATSVGVWQTFVTMAVIYFVFMLGGAFGYRLPPGHWRPEGWTPPTPGVKAMITHGHVHLGDAHNSTVLADLGRAVPQRQRGYRRHRRRLAHAAESSQARS
jgi:MFS family permease